MSSANLEIEFRSGGMSFAPDGTMARHNWTTNSFCGFRCASMRRNPRKLEILRMHNKMLVLFVLEDLGKRGVDLFLRRPHCILVGDTSLMSKEVDL